MCDPSIAGHEYLLDWEFMKAITCTYANVAGYFVVGLMVYGAVGISVYLRTGSAVIPTVLLLLTGGAVMSVVAPPMVAIATVLLLTVGAGAITVLYYRYSR